MPRGITGGLGAASVHRFYSSRNNRRLGRQGILPRNCFEAIRRNCERFAGGTFHRPELELQRILPRNCFEAIRRNCERFAGGTFRRPELELRPPALPSGQLWPVRPGDRGRDVGSTPHPLRCRVQRYTSSATTDLVNCPIRQRSIPIRPQRWSKLSPVGIYSNSPAVPDPIFARRACQQSSRRPCAPCGSGERPLNRNLLPPTEASMITRS